jgi:hypothetical protein
MSLASACWWTLARTILVCMVAWPFCLLVERWIRRISDRGQSSAFALLLAPFLFPELIVGYSYRSLALSSPHLAEGLCLGLLLFRIVPVGVITLNASPPALESFSAIHCRWLLWQANPWSLRDVWQFVLCLWHGPIRRAFPALGLMSLVAFQEFELAALLQTASWTDWFIAAQRLGLDRREMLMQSAWPVLMQVPLIVGVIYWTSREHDSSSEQHDEQASSSVFDWMAMSYLLLAVICGCFIPIGFLSSNLISGIKLLFSQRSQLTGLTHEMIIATAVSFFAAVTAWSLSRSLTSNKKSSPLQSIPRVFLLPGLAGSLLLSLATGSLFQQSWLRPLYDTPVPWVLVLIVWLLPRAVLVQIWIRSTSQTEALHLAELLAGHAIPNSGVEEANESSHAVPAGRASALRFRLRDEPRLLAVALLCYWAYLDLSSAYLLAPSGMPAGLVRLYNFMHFGRTSALSAEASLFFGFPIIAAWFVLLIQRTRLSR